MRLLALVELLYGSGLRATELVSLPLTALPRDVPLLAITGKGGQQRLVPVSTRALAALWPPFDLWSGAAACALPRAFGAARGIGMACANAAGISSPAAVSIAISVTAPVCGLRGRDCGRAED